MVFEKQATTYYNPYAKAKRVSMDSAPSKSVEVKKLAPIMVNPYAKSKSKRVSLEGDEHAVGKAFPKKARLLQAGPQWEKQFPTAGSRDFYCPGNPPEEGPTTLEHAGNGVFFGSCNGFVFMMLPEKGVDGGFDFDNSLAALPHDEDVAHIKQKGEMEHCLGYTQRIDQEIAQYYHSGLSSELVAKQIYELDGIEKIPCLQDISAIVTDESAAIDFLVHNEIIWKQKRCEKCGSK